MYSAAGCIFFSCGHCTIKRSAIGRNSFPERERVWTRQKLSMKRIFVPNPHIFGVKAGEKRRSEAGERRE